MVFFISSLSKRKVFLESKSIPDSLDKSLWFSWQLFRNGLPLPFSGMVFDFLLQPAGMEFQLWFLHSSLAPQDGAIVFGI